jgi:hypothetical protein
MRVCHPLHPVEPPSPIPADLPSRSDVHPHIITTHQPLRHHPRVETHQGALPHENTHNRDAELQSSPQGGRSESLHAHSPSASHPNRGHPALDQFHNVPQMFPPPPGRDDETRSDCADPLSPPFPHNSPPGAWDDLDIQDDPDFQDNLDFPNDLAFHDNVMYDDWINHGDEGNHKMAGADSDGDGHDGDLSGRIRRTYHPLVNGEC